MGSLTADLDFRGLVYQTSDPELATLLDRGGLTAYVGFDPSSDSLHAGNLLQLCMLRRLQLAGHRPIVVAGGGTGRIGDPGGKDAERPLLTSEQLQANLVGIRPQLERFLDFSESAGPSRALMVDNSTWLDELSVIDFLRDVGKHFTVNQMVAKDSVRSRFERADQGISFTEFAYMLIQAYDYLHLFDTYGCRLQMGGSDQWGNIVSGVELIRRARGETAYALTTPLVTKADGTKFGKSESGAVYLDPAKTSPYAFYQFFFRSEDAVVGRYLRMFTFLGHEEILALDEAAKLAPQAREAQRALARAVTTLVHGEEETARVERAAAALYSEDIAAVDEATLLMVVADAPATTMPRSVLDDEGLDVVAVLADSGLSPSRGAARTAVAQGGAYVNNRRVPPEGARITTADLVADRYVLLRRGRRDLHLLQFS
ncbi:MAG: tyrosyl-tRNA synthetase [Acidimicrobiaceae bacterium]|nr:tyrosyl-tRNA synthetase [Acidimicrobiaceae bacterium]